MNPLRRRRFVASVVLAAATYGTLAAILFARAGLTLSHYDARAHLVGARRIADSLTPGWQQIGGVGLPLPHLLNAIPAQIDRFFYSGASGVVISILSFALAAGAIAAIVSRVTSSLWPAAAAVFVFAINPNLLYLQSTPMSEPLMLGVTLAAVALLLEWCAAAGGEGGGAAGVTADTTLIGVAFALACLTRYEAWPVTVIAMAGALLARRQARESVREAFADVLPIAVYPAATIVVFSVFSRVVTGRWFASGLFVPENPALGHPGAAGNQILTGVRALGGTLTTVVALVGLVGLLARGLLTSSGAVMVALAPAAAAALPWLAFVQGYPHGIRYMVPLLPAQAIGIGAAAGRWRHAAPVAAVVLMIVAGLEIAPMYGAGPVTAEAQWDLPNAAARQRVTACLEADYDGTTIMASMGSLGRYMQELSRAGFRIRDFLHDGNGDLWLSAIVGARPFVGWVLIEESVEGGDVLAVTARENPRLLDGFSRVCEGGGAVLYRRH